MDDAFEGYKKRWCISLSLAAKFTKSTKCFCHGIHGRERKEIKSSCQEHTVLVQRELEFSMYWDSLNLKTQTGEENA